ncbi:MAG: hypothetical protein AB8G11_21375 [Saprospiraceae bacterium]
MKKQLQQTTFILLLTFISTATFAQKKLKYDKAYFDKFPTYEAVIEAYFAKNEFDRTTGQSMKFAKKHDGWYGVFTNEKFEEIDEWLIWSAKTTSFKNLKIKGANAGDSRSIEKAKKKYIRGLDPMFFAQYPLYGYHGYEDDIIKLLENEANLSAEILDALARSYSSKGIQILTPGQFGGKKKTLKYDQTFNPNDWETEVLEEFVELMNKSIATFKTLSDKYPDYQTIVGNIKTKYYNEYMSAYYVLKYSGKTDLAKQYLVDDLYTDFHLKTAENYLKTCATNAILFTTGDNDTYPLIYVQDKLGIRKDVKIINTSLASLGRYIHFIKNEFKLPTTLELDKYKLDNHNYIGIINEVESVDLQDYFKAVNEDENIYIDEVSGVRYLPSKQGTFVVQPTESNESSVHFYFNKNYIVKSEIFILDLITTDNWQTPIYFSVGSYYTTKGLGIQDYITLEGLSYRFFPKSKDELSLLETNILYNFKYQENNNIDWFSTDNSIHLNYYQTAFLELLKFRKDYSLQVEVILERMEMFFPHATISYKYQAADFADFCYDAEMMEEGDAFIRNEVTHVHQYFKSIENKKELTYFDKQTVRTMLYTARRLTKIARTNEREAFINLADDFQQYLIKYGE